ncbi:MAG: hypothetical protein M3R10_05460, partial [Verrucomicrobiota bacterium]|nr:hypothetical protein [Verrucomicrobiota bacterium]
MKASLKIVSGKKITALLLTGLILGISAADLLAAGHPRVRQVNRRFETQQDRIGRGVKSGALTARETARLENREANLKAQESFFRTENGGHLTVQEQAKLNHEENGLSRSIYQQKHDAQVQNVTPKSEVGQRLENQQDRIAQGVTSGALTARETSRLEARETFLSGQIASDRNANGGKLTAAERTQINGELNHLSGQIYRQKH